MSAAWFYSHNNERKGPVDLQTLKLLIASGTVNGASLIWQKGMPTWVPAATVEGMVADMPPPIPQARRKPSCSGVEPEVETRSVQAGLRCPNPFLAEVLLAASSAVLAVTSLLIVMQAQIAGLFVLLTLCGFIAAIAFSAIFIYRAWVCVPAVHRSTTPEKAVGFLFIPVFNFYWFFVGIRGLSADTERALKSSGIDQKAPVMLGVINAILLVAAAVFCWVPFLCHIVFGASVVVFGLWMAQQAQATVCLAGAPAKAQPNPKPWLLGLCGSAALFTLLLLVDDVNAVKADAARARIRSRHGAAADTGRYGYSSEQERHSEYLQNVRRANSGGEIEWAGPAESAEEEKMRQDVEALAGKNRANSDYLKSVRDSWAPAH